MIATVVNTENRHLFVTCLPRPKPTSGSYANFNYYVVVDGIARPELTISVHPRLSNRQRSKAADTANSGFDEATRFLKKDNDAKRQPNDSEIDNRYDNPDFNVTTYLRDDVPAYVDWIIRFARWWPTFPSCASDPCPSGDWEDSFGDGDTYLDIEDDYFLGVLARQHFANIKVVRSIKRVVNPDGSTTETEKVSVLSIDK